MARAGEIVSACLRWMKLLGAAPGSFGGATRARQTFSKVLTHRCLQKPMAKGSSASGWPLVEDFCIEKPSTASFRLVIILHAGKHGLHGMVLTPTGNSMAISIIEKFKTFGREAKPLLPRVHLVIYRC